MSELLFELFSEEIPARMQKRAAEQLATTVGDALRAAELAPTGMSTAVTPRRLVLFAEGIPASQPDRVEERRGPKVGAPDKAVQGFLKSVGLTSVDDCEIQEQPKGSFYVARIEHRGRPTLEVLGEILTKTVAEFSWPKSMRWGSHDVRWVRPLHSILALYSGEVVPVTFGPVTSSRVTRGHRFLAPDEFAVESIADYREKLARAHVVLDPEERMQRIADESSRVSSAEHLEVRQDPGLLAEVAGLVEDPVVLLGHFDESYLRVPQEILETAMRAHQKYFALSRPDKSLAPAFLVVSNMRARDGGERIRAGNERVLRARLADAAFFWDQDRKQKLESRAEALLGVVYQAKFGEGADRVGHKAQRITELAAELAASVGADETRARRAAALAKCDLSSGVVGEFPELQGVMGRYYAEHDGEHEEVCAAIAEHYQPAGADDAVPTAPVSLAVALADRLDTLVGFFAIGEKPTGSKDPFALRRAALGVLRTVLENELRIPLRGAFAKALAHFPKSFVGAAPKDLEDQLLAFFADRLTVYLRDEGLRHDVIRAAFSARADDDLTRLVRKVRALQEFLGGDDGANLLAAYRRATNILRIEEKKDGTRFDAAPDAGAAAEDAEKALFRALDDAEAALAQRLEAEDFVAAMTALASLRAPLDRFFEEVVVNADDQALRENRLRLLARIRTALDGVADFGVIEG
jgi:glycyl-tRNA synthetase beta chain